MRDKEKDNMKSQSYMGALNNLSSSTYVLDTGFKTGRVI